MAENRNRGSNKDSGKDQRGFASMDRDRVREIARKGGEASHKNDDKNRGRS